MKKSKLYLLLTILITIYSCGNKTENKNSSENIETTTENCSCSDISSLENLKNITKKGSEELYSGKCFIKDQHDKIIREVEIKNGWLTSDINKSKIQNDYVTTSMFEYENGEKISGWEIFIEKEFNSDYIFVNNYKELKSKDGLNWDIYIDGKGDGKDFPYYISITFKDKTDEESKKLRPKCMQNAEFFGSESINYRDSYKITRISKEKFIEILDCLKKEYPNFNYWKK